MKRIITCIVFFLMAFQYQTKATHIAAADIYYVHDSGMNYTIHLKLYRDCLGISQGTTENVCYISVDSGVTGTITMDTLGSNDPGNTLFFDGLCPGVLSQCYSPSSLYTGYQYFHYIGHVTLPNKAKDWKFIWQVCCRNNAISNLTTSTFPSPPAPGSLTISVWAGLNNLNRYNSSAELTIRPIPYVCINQADSYLNGPVDPDLDSLVFVPITPENTISCSTGISTDCSYVPPYTQYNPVPSSYYSVNSQTGVASFMPTATGNYVLAFRCYEIDKITHDTVGSVMRDVQVKVTPCAAPPAAVPISPVGLTGGYWNGTEIYVCPGTQMTFSVTGTSPSPTNLIYSYADNLTTCPGSSTTVSPASGTSNSSTETFVWTPSSAQSGTHVLTFTYVDSTCGTGQPIVIRSYGTYIIHVLPGVSGGGPYAYCPQGDSAHLVATGPPGITSWQWNLLPASGGTPSNFSMSDSLISNPNCAPLTTSTYVVTALPITVTGCPNKDTVTVTVFPFVNVNAGPDIITCANVANTIQATTTSPGTYSWTPSTFLNATNVLQPVCTPISYQQYVLHYTALPANGGCKYTDSMKVIINGASAILAPLSEKDTVCKSEPFQLFANASPQPCGISQNFCTNDTLRQVGVGLVQQSNFSPFYIDQINGYVGYRAQYLFHADELNAAGMKPGSIKGLTFKLNSSNSGTLGNFKINMGCTSTNDFSGIASFISGLTNVYNSNSFVSTIPTTVINFSSATNYFWDGKNNLVVEICYTKPALSSNSSDVVYSDYTSFVSSIINQSGVGNCNTTSVGASVASVRPTIGFNSCSLDSLFTYTWTPSIGLVTPTSENPKVANGMQNNTTYTVVATSKANSTCTATSTKTVVVDVTGSVSATATPAHLCEPGLTTLTATPNATAPLYLCDEQNVSCISGSNMYVLSSAATGLTLSGAPFNWNDGSRTQILYTVAELNAMGITKGKIDSIAFNIITKNSTLPYGITIKMGCKNTPSLSGFVNAGDMKTVYISNAYTTKVGWNSFPFTNTFLWNGTSNLIVELCYYDPGVYHSYDYVEAVNAVSMCYGANSTNSGCDLPNSGTIASITTPASKPNIRIYACDIPTKSFQYIWTPPLYVFDSTAQSTTAYVLQPSTTYTISIRNRHNCLISNTVNVKIETHGLTVTPTDTAFCVGDKVQVFATGSGSATQTPTYSWSPTTNINCTNCLDPILSPVVPTIYSIVRTDEFGCLDTAKVNINVHPTPNVVITTPTSVTDTVLINYGSTLTLEAAGAVLYSWSPVWNMSTPNIYQTIITPDQPGWYYVYGLDSNNCGNKDSIYVNLNYDSPIPAPNAFSPNGDNNNDKFKLPILPWQRVQDFRVFNRWGQEMFAAFDNNGWDGTFNGKDAAMDTYYYVIKVAYPNGITKTLKGDVMLVR